ncbi:unnamed protein product [Adineta ricciae]|uniref:Uncharacterized protein n=1 Tax=Adineta ricciae TaxID=249248 RepID=A0A815BL28_ADIRI|nr:unnamed protein product [Adineta ricciae]
MQHHTSDSWIDIQSEEKQTPTPETTTKAQKESSRVGSKSSHSDSSSPKSPKSPIQTDENVANWMLYWSRVESEPPKEWKFLHPINRSVRDQLLDEDEEERAAEEAAKALIEKKRMRYVLLSNCASFLLGMGIMYLCLRRYLRMKTPYFYTLD